MERNNVCVAKLFILLLFSSSYHWPCSKCPNFETKIYFSSLYSFLPKWHLPVRTRRIFFVFILDIISTCPKNFIVSPLISSSPTFFFLPFVLHALLSFRSFHFYPQMTFYVPSAAFISNITLCLTHKYTHTHALTHEWRLDDYLWRKILDLMEIMAH